MGDSRGEVGQQRRAVSATYKESSSVPQNVIHVTNQLMRCTNEKWGSELWKVRWRATLAENTWGVLHEVELENPIDSFPGQSAGWISVTRNSRFSGIDNAF